MNKIMLICTIMRSWCISTELVHLQYVPFIHHEFTSQSGIAEFHHSSRLLVLLKSHLDLQEVSYSACFMVSLCLLAQDIA